MVLMLVAAGVRRCWDEGREVAAAYVNGGISEHVESCFRCVAILPHSIPGSSCYSWRSSRLLGIADSRTLVVIQVRLERLFRDLAFLASHVTSSFRRGL